MENCDTAKKPVIEFSDVLLLAQAKSLCRMLNNGEIRIYQGEMPKKVSMPAKGKLLAVVRSNSTRKALNFKVVFVKGKYYLSQNPKQEWSGTATATGEARYLRYVINGDQNKKDDEAVRFQTLITLPLRFTMTAPITKNRLVNICDFNLYFI